MSAYSSTLKSASNTWVEFLPAANPERLMGGLNMIRILEEGDMKTCQSIGHTGSENSFLFFIEIALKRIFNHQFP